MLAKEFDDLLPHNELPVNTKGYEGFHHLCNFNGDCENTMLNYIIRNHNFDIIQRQIQDFYNARDIINKKYNNDFVSVDIKESYRNMKEIIEKHPEVLVKVTDAYKRLDIPYEFEPIRGGTDGARLSFMGLPCPNLGDGGYNFHGRYEYVSLTQMRKMVKVLIEIVRC